MKKKKSNWGFAIMLLVLFGLVSLIISGIFSLFLIDEPRGNVALIKIEGVIIGGGNLGFGTDYVSSSEIVELIEEANENSGVEAIIFQINSGGGGVVASKEIADAVKEVNKTTVSVIREAGASGAYWVASTTDKIYADEFSITGSIGVISSYIEFKGLLERYNMTYRRLVAGDHKDIGDPFKELEKDERKILQDKLDIIHDYFIKEVSKNRNLEENYVRNISTGEFYLGIEALEYGLIDELGNMDSAEMYLEKKLNTTISVAEYQTEPSFIDMLSGVASEKSFFIGKGIGDSLTKNNMLIRS